MLSQQWPLWLCVALFVPVCCSFVPFVEDVLRWVLPVGRYPALFLGLASNNNLARLVKASDKVSKSFFFFFSSLLFKREKTILCVSTHQSLTLWSATWFLCLKYYPLYLPHNEYVYYLLCATYIRNVDRSNAHGRCKHCPSLFLQDIPMKIGSIWVVVGRGASLVTEHREIHETF